MESMHFAHKLKHVVGASQVSESDCVAWLCAVVMWKTNIYKNCCLQLQPEACVSLSVLSVYIEVSKSLGHAIQIQERLLLA